MTDLPSIDFADWRPPGPLPERHREDTRRWIAFTLLAVFAVEIAALLYAWLWLDRPMEQIKEIATLLVMPTIGLVGAATGFFYAKG